MPLQAAWEYRLSKCGLIEAAAVIALHLRYIIIKEIRAESVIQRGVRVPKERGNIIRRGAHPCTLIVDHPRHITVHNHNILRLKISVHYGLSERIDSLCKAVEFTFEKPSIGNLHTPQPYCEPFDEIVCFPAKMTVVKDPRLKKRAFQHIFCNHCVEAYQDIQ